MGHLKLLDDLKSKLDSVDHEFNLNFVKTKRLKDLEKIFNNFSIKILVRENLGFKVKQKIERETIFLWFKKAGLVNKNMQGLESDIEWCFDSLDFRSNDR